MNWQMNQKVIEIVQHLVQMSQGMEINRRETVVLAYIIGQLTAKLVEGQTILRKTRKMWFKGEMNAGFFEFLNLQAKCDDKRCPMEHAVPHRCNLNLDKNKIAMHLIIPSVLSNRSAYIADIFT